MSRKPTKIAPVAEPMPGIGTDIAVPAGPALEPLLRELTQRVLDAMNRNAAAVLAAGIMASRGRPHTPEEAIRLHQEMISTMWPKAPAPARSVDNISL